MNLNERIDEACGMSLDSVANKQWRGRTRSAVKKLIRECLEHVKPEAIEYSEHSKKLMFMGGSRAEGYNTAIYEMEAKAKELGL